MAAFFKGIFPVTLLFLYIYPQTILGFPISTRVMMGVLGFFIMLSRLRPAIFRPFKGAIPIAVLAIITAVFNQTWDFQFVFYVASMLIVFFGAYTFVSIFPKYTYNANGINALLKIFVIAVLVQSIAAIIMFVSPPAGEILRQIFPYQMEADKLERIIEYRLIGLGTGFFGAGIVSGLALIIIVYLYLGDYVKRHLIWTFFYIVILFVGLMMARTTSIGFAASMLLLLIWQPTNKKSIAKKFKWAAFLIIALILAVSYMLANASEELLQFAFEFFYSYDKTGEFRSASTDSLQTMYYWPDELKTWFIGDGLYNLKRGYYMHTDVGYLRLLYYGGLPMVFAYYYFSWYIICRIKRLGVSPLMWQLLIVTFVYLLILGLKGLADLNFFFLLIYIALYFYKRRSLRLR